VVIGKFREALVKPIAKNDNLWLSVVDKGFCTPPMNEYNDLEIGCDLETMKVEVANANNNYDSINIKGKTASELSDELVSLLSSLSGLSVNLKNGFDSSNKYDISEKDAHDFLTQLVNYNELLKSFHKKINIGVKTQICLWPHHFDNSFKWFSGKKINEEDEQMGIGVSNGDEMYELPYIYMTFYPPLRKTNTLEVPEGAFLHDSDWTGMILPYEAVIEKKTTEAQKSLVDNFFDVSFESIKRAFSKR
jgi:hypothetical protein